MEKQSKVDLVEGLVGTILRDMIQNLEEDRVPAGWDSVELRWWITDHFRPFAILRLGRTPIRNRARYLDYLNDRLIGGV